MTEHKAALAVMSLSQASRHKRKFEAVLSLESPSTRPAERLRFTKHPRPDHLVLRFEDLDEPGAGATTATREHVFAALSYARAVEGKSLLVHCQAGVGRSAGVALAVLADRLGPGRERKALDELLALRPESVPNLLVVKHADDLLGRGGALLAVVLAENERREDWRSLRARKAKLFQDRPDAFS